NKLWSDIRISSNDSLLLLVKLICCLAKQLLLLERDSV
ncbi:MAG: hypothetical protein ACI9MF_002027, partial [Gammaproteobacteria bacterium]